MPARSLIGVLLVLGLACGGSTTTDYERDASAVCREFNDAAFAEQVEVERAEELYGGLADGLARLSPPDDLRRTHDVVLGFARAGEQAFKTAGGPGTPKVDLRLSVGGWEDEVPRVERELPTCADSLTGTHPEIQIIR